MLISGCATIPKERHTEPRTFRIHGEYYFSLSDIAELHHMRLDWDEVSQKVLLESEKLRIKLRVGSAVTVVDDQAHTLDRPILFHRGHLVVPDSFPRLLLKYLEREKPPPSISRPVHIAILDAGHGGEDTGAVGPGGLKEKHVVLDITRLLKNELQTRGLDSVMTRQDDHFISLYQRTFIANREAGDFFVSIHCNASLNREVNGFEVYYLGPAEEDTLSLLPDAEAHASTEDRAESVELAREIASAMEQHLSFPNRGIKSARFFVLRGAWMPAVLVEVGYISNPAEEASLGDTSYRQNIAKAIAEGIMAYKDGYEARISESAYRNF